MTIDWDYELWRWAVLAETQPYREAVAKAEATAKTCAELAEIVSKHGSISTGVVR